MYAHECSHSRQISLIRQSEEPEMTYVNKAGWLYKRGRLQRRWVRRWFSVNSHRCSFKYCNSPGPALDCGKSVLPGKIVSAAAIHQPCKREGVMVFGLTVTDSTNRRRTFFCDTKVQRDSWVWYLSRVAHTQVYLKDRYTVDWHTVIGSGAYADVVRGWDRTSEEEVAVKVVSRAACQRHFHLMNKEVAVMHMVGAHPHLLTLREVFYSAHHIYIITDILAGGELHARVVPSPHKPCTPYSEAEARVIVRQLLLALSHLHSKGVAHCDVKPENLMFTSSEENSSIKLIDYNSAVFFEEPTEPGGTPEYMAPELISCHEDLSRTGWGPEPDMWAVGCLTFWLLCGHTPFTASTIPKVLWNIEKGSFRWPRGVALSEDVKSLIQFLLRRDPRQRPTATQLLAHPWLASPLPCSAEVREVAGKLNLRLPGLAARGDSPLVHQLLADARGAREVPWSQMPECTPPPGGVPCEDPAALIAATTAAMALPRNLSIKTAVPPLAIKIQRVFAASAVADGGVCPLDTEEAVEAEPAWQAEEDDPFWEEGAVITLAAYGEDEECQSSCTEREEPLDSCMSMHEDTAFQTSRLAGKPLPLLEHPRQRTPSPERVTPHCLWQTEPDLESASSSGSGGGGADSSPVLRRSCTDSFAEMADIFKDRNWGNDLAAEGAEGGGEDDNDTAVPLTDRLPRPSEHLEFRQLHQVVVRRKAFQALVRATREKRLPGIVQEARSLIKHGSA